MMFKALNAIMPDYLSNMFVKTSDSRSADNDVVRVSFARTSYFENLHADRTTVCFEP